MKPFRNRFIHSILFIFLSSQVCAEPTKSIPGSIDSVKSMYLVAAAKNTKAMAVISELLDKKDYISEDMQNVEKRYRATQEHIQKLNDKLQKQLPGFNKKMAYDSSKINFTDLRIDDAIVFLRGAAISARLTSDLLINMRELAVRAANSTNTSTDRKNLDMEFQMYKQIIGDAQTISLVEGLKKVGGGALTVYTGSGYRQKELLKVNLPKIDPVSLGVSDNNLLTVSNAMNAIASIDRAHLTLSRYSAIASEELYDIETMFLYVPYMLHQNYQLIIWARDYALTALNPTINDQDREYLNTVFKYFKLAMRRTQTYLSLSGALEVGGGAITISTSDMPSPEYQFTLDIPATDIFDTGIVNMDISTLYSAQMTFIGLVNIMRDFVYYPNVKPAS